jgi:hypothetical protein
MYLPGSTTDLGEGKLDTPDFTLVSETVLANELQFGVPRTCLELCSDMYEVKPRHSGQLTDEQTRMLLKVSKEELLRRACSFALSAKKQRGEIGCGNIRLRGTLY